MSNETEKRTLYLVATPIGNLLDITMRALKVLGEVDFIAAEDTRVSGKLLSHYDIKKPLVNYFEHNKSEMGEKILRRLQGGESCALITDAGSPAISDPGQDLCDLCIRNGVRVVPVPGACAAITALCGSGLDSHGFLFLGFLPRENNEKQKLLERISNESYTMVFYEAPHRLKKTLSEFCDVLGGDRVITISRELTKINEEFVRCTLSEAVSMYNEKEPRGEYVLVISGKQTADDNAFWLDMSIKGHVEFYISSGLSKMDAMKKCARDRGLSKNEVYKQMLD